MLNTEFLITASQKKKKASDLGKRQKRQEEYGGILKSFHTGRQWNRPEFFSLKKRQLKKDTREAYIMIYREILITMTLE